MVTIDLITGFLGSGKTTFIKHYAKYLMDQGMNIGILENDFGAVNVDVMLLQDILGDHCDMESISGGCDCDTHQRRMRTKLISLAMQGFDRVIIEPSGIFDVDEFFDILHDEPLDKWYRMGNVIAIVDAKQEQQLSPQSAGYPGRDGFHGKLPEPRVGAKRLRPPLWRRCTAQKLGGPDPAGPGRRCRLRQQAGQL